jgi:hypothetical protein
MRFKLWIAGPALSAALAVTACSELLVEEPQEFTTTDTFYKTGADLNSATIAIYAAFKPGFAAFGGLIGQAPWTTPELASDQARADNREPNFNTRSPDYIDWSPTTGQTGGYWGLLYSVITRANLVLARGPGIETPNQQMRDYNLAEAKFLRAYAYLWLTKVYDGVPLLLTPEEQANPSPERAPIEQVHQAMIQDLTEAEAALPETWSGTDGFGLPTQGRVTKGAAQMALADLYLWRSTYMRKNEWQQASTWAKRVMDSGTWSLNADYTKTFRPRNKGNREMIFVLTNTGADARTSNVFQLFYYPRDWGLDLGQGGGWGLIHPTDWFWNSYLSGDYRRSTGVDHTSEAAYVTGGCSVSGICVTSFADGPMPWKYKKSDGGATWWLGDVDVPLYRFAEAILIYVEAENELGNTAVAVTNLNRIRARARNGTGAENRAEPHDYGAAGEPMDQASVREAIYMERAWELAFEAKRWFDLVRRDSREPGYWLTSLRQHDPNAESRGSLAGQEHKKRFPIPQGQIDANPALCQNAGYGGNQCGPGVQP